MTDELFCLAQFGQYQGAGVLTGFGLLRWHMAQRKRWPLTADFGRIFLPVLRIFSAMAASGTHSVQSRGSFLTKSA
jgi:hypothetical protein